MCTILLAWRLLPDHPVLLAANRDELRARPSEPPQVLAGTPRIAGGRDAVAGGTWLAVREDGTVAAVTNRRAASGVAGRDDTRRSRGEIPLELLTTGDDAAALTWLSGLRSGVYNPVNVVYISSDVAVVAHVEDGRPTELIHLQPGMHVITVFGADPAAAKNERLQGMLEAAGRSDASDTLRAMQQLLRLHDAIEDDPLTAACLHGDVYGTVSASTAELSERSVRYTHAQGRPCETPFEDYSLLLDGSRA